MWDRNPDKTKIYPKGQIEASWISEDKTRMVSILFYREAELTLQIWDSRFEDWMWHCSEIYDAADPAVREQAWVWLNGGSYPDQKLRWLDENFKRNG